MTAPATTSDREALLLACVLSPECDATRLVYADWLDEHGDDTDARHAELLRASVELGQRRMAHLPDGDPCTCHRDNLPDSAGTYCGACQRRSGPIEAIRARVADLTASLRDRLLPPCPNPKCQSGTVGRQSGIGGHSMGGPCEVCQDSVVPGVCPGEIVRGLPIIAVPLAVLGKEVLNSGDTGLAVIMGKANYTWHPSDFARSCVRRGIGVRVTDREPYNEAKQLAAWRRGSSRNSLNHWLIPDTVFDAVVGEIEMDSQPTKWFPTTAAANAALGAALVRMAV